MALYMTQFSYTAQAWAALAKNPEDREKVLAGLVERMGGRMLSFYYSFGEYDGVFTYEAPDDATAAALVIAAIAPGHVKDIRTTKLLTMQDTLDVMRKAGGASYRAPAGG